MEKMYSRNDSFFDRFFGFPRSKYGLPELDDLPSRSEISRTRQQETNESAHEKTKVAVIQRLNYTYCSRCAVVFPSMHVSHPQHGII